MDAFSWLVLYTLILCAIGAGCLLAIAFDWILDKWR